MNTQLIRPKKAAQKLDCSLTTIYRMFDRGELSRIRITKGSVGIPKQEIDKILNPEKNDHGDLEVR